ncbi:hypothetical protein ACFT43_05050 [Streptomyces albidoflavus]
MATANPTDRQKTKKTGPPVIGDRPSLRIDDDLAADLATLMRVHPTFAEAVRQAVGQLATTYRTAWAHQVCPTDTAPVLLAYQLEDPAKLRPTRPVGVRLPGPPPGRQLRPAFTEELLAEAPARPDAERTART